MFIKEMAILSTSNILNINNLSEITEITVSETDPMLRHIVLVGELEISLDATDWTSSALEIDFTRESVQKIFIRPTTGLDSGSGTITVEEI